MSFRSGTRCVPLFVLEGDGRGGESWVILSGVFEGKGGGVGVFLISFRG